MISKQSVYLNLDRSKAVAEGDPEAKFLLVREGQEIAPELADKYEGAAGLVGKASKHSDAEPAKPKPKRKK